MRRLFVVSVLLTLGFDSVAETQMFKYWVSFTDKNGSPYSLERPSEFLSERALQRRRNQNIALSVEDIPVNPSYISGVCQRGVKLLHRSRWFNAITVQVSDSTVMAEVRRLPYVRQASILGYTNPGGTNESDFDFEIMGSDFSHENPESFYGVGERQISMLNGISLHERGFKGQGMLIAVLDAGFLRGNQVSVFDSVRLKGQIKYKFDYVSGDQNVYDDDDHGLKVFSCMAANNPHELVGTAPGANYLLLRTEDANSELPIEESNWVAAAEFADSAGADIINSSLGYTDYDDKQFGLKYSQLDGKTAISSRAAYIAARKGILVVNAAGNEGNKSWHYIGAPADADSILTVGAVDAREVHAAFSSYGPSFDGRIKPTISAMGEATMVVTPKGNISPADGTSFASPILCGLVACLWQAAPQRSSFEIMEAVIKSSDRYFSPDNTYGYGIPDFIVALTVLGANQEFDYSKEQWVESPIHIGKLLGYHFYSTSDQKATLRLMDEKGKLIENQEIQLKKGFNKSSFNSGKLNGSVYFLEIVTPSGTYSSTLEL